MRDWAADEIGSFEQLIKLWRFEDQAGSASTPEAIYLDGVRNADVVLFLAGSDTSDATASEVLLAVEQRIDIIGLLLSCPTRSAQVTELIARIRSVSTTKAVDSTEDAVRAAVRDSVKTWLVDRIAGTDRPQRISMLRMLDRESIFRMQASWKATGVDDLVAAQLAASDAITSPILTETVLRDVSFGILCGPIGSGKTLTLERLFQKAVHDATLDVLAPIPVFVSASSVEHGIETIARSSTTGLGSLEINGTFLTIDRLDEVDDVSAERIMRDAWVFQKTHPNSKVILAGRHAAPPDLKEFELQIPEMPYAMVYDLLTRLGIDRPDYVLMTSSGTIREALLRPLFAIVYAISGFSRNFAVNEAVVARALIERGLNRNERRAVSSDVIEELSIRLLDSTTALVPQQEFSDDDQAKLLATRLVTASDGVLRMPLRLVVDYAAALWLAKHDRSELMSRISAGAQASRWRSAITYYLQNLQDAEAEDVVTDIASVDPVLAFQIAKSDETKTDRHWDPSDLRDELTRVEVLVTTALGFSLSDDQASVQVERHEHGFGVIRTFRDADDGVLETLTFLLNFGEKRHEVIMFIKGLIISRLEYLLKRRLFSVENAQLKAEQRWNQALLLLGKGASTQEDLPIEPILETLSTIDSAFNTVVSVGNHHNRIDVIDLSRNLSSLFAAGVTHLVPPFVVGDRSHGKWVWSQYSPDRLIERRRIMVEFAMSAYVEIVQTCLPGLTMHLQKFLLVPAAYHETVRYDGDNEPWFADYWEPLPQGYDINFDVKLGDVGHDPNRGRELQGLVEQRRPAAKERLPISTRVGVLRMWSSWPVRELAYQWLFDDLKAIGLVSSIALPEAR